MSLPQLATPVGFFIFNRPRLTQRVFEEIRRARPLKLLVVADGPRDGSPDDQSNCAATRQVISGVDWPCEVLTNYSEENLGCKRRVASGLDWVFEMAEEAIILEDDCLPHPTFFRFCEELLARYRDDERIFHISGNHFRFIGEKSDSSYYFSRIPCIWGWASWRRAWNHFQVEMPLWPQVRDGGWLETFFSNRSDARRWTQILQTTYDGQLNTWDSAWTLACWINSGLSIRPHVNLVSNIGWDTNATHTTDTANRNANLPTEAMAFPIQHPAFMMRDAYEDLFTTDPPRTRWHRAAAELKHWLADQIPKARNPHRIPSKTRFEC